MTITVNHAKTNAISDWTQAQLDEQIALGNFAEGTVLADIVLPSDWNNDHTLTGIGTMAEQDANSVAITGGTINNASIGATTASTGTFTTLIGGNDVANYGQLTGGATTKAIEWKSLGSDSNVAFAIISKGTGAINLSAGSRGVNISNGGTVTAITRTATGSLYTSLPSVAITAPTTAGGVQATASPNMFLFGSSIATGGTGYTVGDVLTISGGTFAVQAQVTVATVSAGVITSITNGPNNGNYSVLPSTPATVTGGTGTGATVNANNWGVVSFTITNAGSGYIEQPTVSFSGGGGSGASAYATVGSATKFTSLHTTMSFITPMGEGVRVQDGAGLQNGYLQLQGSTTGSNGVYVTSSANSLYISASSGNAIRFFSNGQGTTEQLRVAHTASAVNYVQVTGAATSVFPIISSQGSDTNLSLGFYSKGTGGFSFRTGGGTNRAFEIINVASAVNRAQVKGSATGSAPEFFVDGTDTNIDLSLTPKGTGVVRFGTRTATSDVAITGYISIKDSGGTTRKLAIID